ncbi:hypothetical protein BgiMline_008705 [Biomphalaria glabrata]|nr:hypothetical protein BgiMline_027279 [Biomphalaria glabrata]
MISGSDLLHLPTTRSVDQICYIFQQHDQWTRSAITFVSLQQRDQWTRSAITFVSLQQHDQWTRSAITFVSLQQRDQWTRSATSSNNMISGPDLLHLPTT